MSAKFPAILLAAASLMAAQQSSESRAMLNQGVAAFKSGNNTEAVQDFQKAVDLDPSFLTARLYLATAYMQQYVPGNASPQNVAMAESALREFNQVLDRDPSNTVAMASVAALYVNQKKWDDAQPAYEKLVAMHPDNAEAYYSLGFIAWSKWYPAYSDARKLSGMKPADPGPLPGGSLKSDIKTRYTPVIEQGIQSLQKALDIKPQYADAMAYMNLLIRERADLVDTPAEYQQDIALANEWVQKALAAKKQMAEAAGSSNSPASGLGGFTGSVRAGAGDGTPPQTIRIAEADQAQRLVTRVAPVPPADTSIHGQVVLAVVIGKDGRPRDIRVQSGHPMLIESALNAVRNWVYQPTLLNGQPVAVATTVTLKFE